MLPAIGLNSDTKLRTGEVEHIWRNRMLATEMPADPVSAQA